MTSSTFLQRGRAGDRRGSPRWVPRRARRRCLRDPGLRRHRRQTGERRHGGARQLGDLGRAYSSPSGAARTSASHTSRSSRRSVSPTGGRQACTCRRRCSPTVRSNTQEASYARSSSSRRAAPAASAGVSTWSCRGFPSTTIATDGARRSGPIATWRSAGGRVYASVNPIVDFSLAGCRGAAKRRPFEPAATMCYVFPGLMSVGVEYYASFGALGTWQPLEEQEHYLFQVINVVQLATSRAQPRRQARA